MKVELVDLRVRSLVVRGLGLGLGLETLTRDKVALHIYVTATFQMVDAAMAAQTLKDYLTSRTRHLNSVRGLKQVVCVKG